MAGRPVQDSDGLPLLALKTMRGHLDSSFDIWVVGVRLLLAIGLGQVLAGFLYDIGRLDPVVLGSAPVLLTLIALIACYVPARRAARVDPLIALRYE